MEVEVSKKNKVSRACGVVFKEKVEVREEQGVGELVFGAGRWAVETGKGDRVAGEFGHNLDRFERGVVERERLREGEEREKTVFEDDGDATTSGGARKRLQAVAARSDAGNDGFITGRAEPGFGYEENVKVVVNHKI